MFVQGSHTCAFAMIYTAFETSPNVCIGKPYLLKLLCTCYVGSLLALYIGLQVAMLQLYI